jgi:sugar phosphate permease
MANPRVTADDEMPEPAGLLDPDERPTWVRYGVLAFLAAMTFILYLDRVCIGQSAAAIEQELGISETQMSWVHNAFIIAYAVFEIPTGRWGDRFGSRGVLTRIVLWWSLFTALTGAATGLTMLLVVRFLFGAGEAGALPNSARVLREWFPESSRGRAQGIITTAMLLGGAVAPLASQRLINAFGWKMTFVIFGFVGLAWAVAFYTWFRDDPAEHRGTNQAERRLIASSRAGHDLEVHGPIPWRLALGCANVWLLGAVMVTMSAIYMLMTYWYPTYLQKARGVSPDQSSLLSMLVLGAGASGCLFGGWLTDALVRKTGNRRWGRTAQSVLGAGLAAGGLLACLLEENVLLSAVFVAVACFGVQIQVPAWWASATQVSGRHVGALFGLMNMLGALGAASVQTFFGRSADLMKEWGRSGRDQWDPGFAVYVGVALIGVVLWSLIDPRKTVEDKQGVSSTELA